MTMTTENKNFIRRRFALTVLALRLAETGINEMREAVETPRPGDGREAWLDDDDCRWFTDGNLHSLECAVYVQASILGSFWGAVNAAGPSENEPRVIAEIRAHKRRNPRNCPGQEHTVLALQLAIATMTDVIEFYEAADGPDFDERYDTVAGSLWTCQVMEDLFAGDTLPFAEADAKEGTELEADEPAYVAVR
jgi:hypothetical protein